MRRTFAREVLEQLSLIALDQAAGFSFEIEGIFSGEACALTDRRALETKVCELDSTIKPCRH